MRGVRGIIVMAAIGMACLGVAASAQARLSDLAATLANCQPGSSHGMSTRPSSVCVVAAGDATAFGTVPGETFSPSIRQVSATATNGYVRAEGISSRSLIWSDWFSNATSASGFVDGTWTLNAVWPGPIGQQTVALRVHGDTSDGKYVSCDHATYLVCEVARSGGDLPSRNRYTFSVVRISTRPLLVRVVNQTGHTLERTSPSILTTNLLRETQIGDPTTIPSYDPAAPDANVGWYEFYRQAVRAKRANSFDTTYTLKSAAQSNLNGATVRVIIAMKADGTDDNSRCIADDRYSTYLQCSVAITGSSRGTVYATAYVAQ
jgi:hypothetical protein